VVYGVTGHSPLVTAPESLATSHSPPQWYTAVMTELLEDALRKVAALPREEQDAIASQIIETLEDETAWKEKLASDPGKLRRLADEALKEQRSGETRPLDELL
jgi:DNA-binding protein H-NS